jgi:hypothetical protein
MNKTVLIALTTLSLSSFALLPATAQRVDIPANGPIAQFDPARLYGWVSAPNTNSGVDMNLRLPSALLGRFDTLNAASEARGPSGLEAGLNVSSQLRIAALRGPAGVGVELRRARVVASSLGDGSGGELVAQLRVFVNSSEFTSGEQLPVEVVLENTQTNSRLSFFVTVAVR